jgi:hypothetical protein
VFVVKLDAVLNATSGATAGRCCGFNGSTPWSRWRTVHDEEPERIERDRGERVVFPTGFVVGAHPHGVEEQTLDGAHDAIDEGGLPLVDTGHMSTERPRESEERGEIEAYLHTVTGGHESFSGASSALPPGSHRVRKTASPSDQCSYLVPGPCRASKQAIVKARRWLIKTT